SSDQSNLSCDISREQKNNQSKIKSPCLEFKLSTDQVQNDIPELSDILSQIAEASTLVIKISYNQKVEQCLLHELFEFIRGTDSMSLQSLKKTPLNSIFIKQISDIPVNIDLTPGSAPHLALSNLSSEKNIGDQMARTQIYDEMMQYLPELDAKVSSSESQKLISVKNSSHVYGQSKSDIEIKACEKTLSETESSHIFNSEDIVNENNEFSETVTIIDSFSDSKEFSDSDGEVSSDDNDSNADETNLKDSSKFPEEKSTIHEAVHKRFPFLSYTNSNAWRQDVFKYTDSEAKCPVCKEVHTRLGIWGDWSCLGKDKHYFLNCPFRIDQKKVIIAVQSLPETQVRVPNKTREDLERDIQFYRGGIERKKDPRKYCEFLTDRNRLVGEELLRRSILESGLSTVWLDDLMEEWQKTYNQFIQIFYQNFDPIEEKTLFVPR
ncbi:8549_t:CDS:2, partial [Diversispora eburnea]